MDNTSYIGLSRQSVLMRQLDIVANNIANTNTAGFKGEEPLFIEHVFKTPSADRPFLDKISFVRDLGVIRDASTGPLTNTGNTLDVALSNEGYFAVDTDSGAQYTRGGHLRLDETGQLVTTDGHPVLSTNDQPFFFAPNESQITIARDGTVSTETGQLGKLRVVKFANEQALQKQPGGLYTTDQQPEDVASPDVLQGMLEGSNVQPIVEITKLIQIQRSYEGINKIMDNESQRHQKAVDVLSRVA
ncbi:MAG: flagellar basal-body rod protein FlgF [Alphaproteobacteria bacterium]|nr:flagellar basal-body rod protein FlgF [Alphaproteobacteria bacterium]